jgi:hypothetical protein
MVASRTVCPHSSNAAPGSSNFLTKNQFRNIRKSDKTAHARITNTNPRNFSWARLLKPNKVSTGQTLAGGSAQRDGQLRTASRRLLKSLAGRAPPNLRSRRANSQASAIQTAKKVKKGRHARSPEAQQPFAFATG